MPDDAVEAPLLYVVAGPMRTGKSIIAARFNRATGVSILSADDLVRMLGAGAPELGIRHDLDWRDRSQKLSPLLDGLAEVRMERGVPLLIEGELSMDHVGSLIGSYQPYVRACCVGDCSTTVEAKLAAIRAYAATQDYDWTRRLSAERLAEFVRMSLADSLVFRYEAERLGIPFFDMSADFEAGVAAAVAYLIEGVQTHAL
jgi:hypothetical protein